MNGKNLTLAELSEFLAKHGFPNEVDGDARAHVHAANTLEDAVEGEISFLANPRYTNRLAETKASVVIVKPEDDVPNGLATLRCADPYGAITAAIVHIHGHRSHPQWGIHDRATIAESAKIGTGANIAPNVTISENATIGNDATLYPGCYIGENVRIGEEVTLFPNVVIYSGCRIGDRVSIHAGTVVGQDGLGYAPVDGAWLKIPQIGTTVIEDDVEIGACCALDRATLGETRIGKGTKFSDMVVIGHGTKVGEHCMFVAQVGVAGSTKIGNHVTLAGQVGVSGHLTIGDNARIGAKSGVHSNIEPGSEYLGSPAVESSAFRRQASAVHRLPKMKTRLRELEAEVEALRKRLDESDASGA